ncbi:MAG: hypothetical protein ABI540_05545 [Spartobacteria bacterium]
MASTAGKARSTKTGTNVRPTSHCDNMTGAAISGMKKFNYLGILLLFGLICAVLSGCETSGTGSSSSTAAMAATSGNAGRLIIRRAPNLAEMLIVSIDGKRVGEVRVADTYNAPIPVGSHVISAILAPNELNNPPTKKQINVVKGQTYTFEAAWEGDRMVLR